MPMIEIPIDDWASPEATVGTGGPPAPGMYHCLCEGVKTGEGYLEVHFKVASPGPELDKQFSERLYLANRDGDKEKTKKMQGRIFSWFYQLGVISQADWDESKKAGNPVAFDPEDASGCQAIVKLVPHKYKDRKTGEDRETCQVEWGGVYRLGHPDTLKVPIDRDAAALAGYNPADTSGESKEDPFDV